MFTRPSFRLTAGLAALLAGLAAACASDPYGDPSVRSGAAPSASAGPVIRLPAQQLDAGRCALFLFERRPPRAFVVFEDETARTVKIVHAGRIHTLPVSDQTSAASPGEPFRRVYSDPDASLTFTLTGQVGEETGSGPRLENVLLEVLDLQGARTVRPLAGVRSCGGEQG